MERNMWQSPPAALCMRLDCLRSPESKIQVSEPRHHSRGESQVAFVSRETLEQADAISASEKLIQIKAGMVPIQLRRANRKTRSQFIVKTRSECHRKVIVRRSRGVHRRLCARDGARIHMGSLKTEERVRIRRDF